MKLYIFSAILLFGFLFFPDISFAADRYWVGADTGATANWNTTASWSDSSGGSSGATVPEPSDSVIFDGGGGKVGGVVIDAAINVASITATAGYTGTGASDGHINNATNNNAINVSGDVVLDNKQISMGSATWTVSGNWDSVHVTTFNKNASVLVMNGADKTLAGKNASVSGAFDKVTISGTITLASTSHGADTLTVSGALTINSGAAYNLWASALDVDPGGSITGTGSLFLGWNTISAMDGTIDLASFEWRPGGSSLTLPAAQYDSASFIISNYIDSNTTAKFASGTTTFTGNVTFRNAQTTTFTINNSTNNSNLVFKGNVAIENTGGSTFTWTKGTGTITLGNNASDGTQTINFAGKTVEDIVIDAPGDIKQLLADVTTDTLTTTAGTLDRNGYTITILEGAAPGDTTPPSVPQGLTATAVSSSQINLSWTASTDDVGVTGYRIYRGGIQIATSAVTTYQDTGLSSSTSYTYTVDAYDAAGNLSAQSSSATATTSAGQAPAGDTTPPVRSAGSPTGVLTSGTTQTTLSLTTNENSTCKYSTSTGTAYSSMTGNFTTTGATGHSTTITGLTSGTSYRYYIRCQDVAGNANTDDYAISFSVANPSTPGEIRINQQWLSQQGSPPYILNQANTTYVLDTNVSADDTAFVISADHVKLDLNGYIITYGNRQANNIQNGGFELGTGNWDVSNAPTFQRTSSVPATNVQWKKNIIGNYSGLFANPQRDEYIISDPISVTANKSYVVSPFYFYRYNTKTIPAYIQVIEEGGNILLTRDLHYPLTYSDHGQVWKAEALSFKSTKSTVRVKLGVNVNLSGTCASTNDCTGNVYFDGVEIKPAYQYGVVKPSHYVLPEFPDLPTPSWSGVNFLHLTNGKIVQGSGAGYFSSAVSLYNSSNAEIDNLEISLQSPSAAAIDVGNGSTDTNIHNDKITYSNVNRALSTHNADAIAIRLSTGRNYIIRDNIIDAPLGIQCSGHGGTCSNSEIFNNNINVKAYTIHSYAVMLVGGSVGNPGPTNFNIYNNNIKNDDGSGIMVAGWNTHTDPGPGPGKIYGNRIEVTDGSKDEFSWLGKGLWLRFGAHDLEIYNNVIIGYAGTNTPSAGTNADIAGVRLSSSNPFGKNIIFRNNTVETHTNSEDRTAVALDIEDGPTDGVQKIIKNNVFKSNKTLISLGGEYSGAAYNTLYESNDFIKADNAVSNFNTFKLAYDKVIEQTFLNNNFLNGAQNDNFLGTPTTTSLYMKWILTLYAKDGTTPIPGANVVIKDNTKKEIYNGLTDSGGKVVITLSEFSLTTPKIKTSFNPYDISVSKSGYVGYSGNINMTQPAEISVNISTGGSGGEALPAFFDWRNKNGKNYITPVKTKRACWVNGVMNPSISSSACIAAGYEWRDCGNCWAFSANGVIEGTARALYNNPDLDVDLSEQDLVSCFMNVCRGGTEQNDDDLFSNYLKNTGVTTESYFPYTANDNSCANKLSGWQNSVWKVNSYKKVDVASLDEIKKALVENGPLMATMKVYGDLPFYTGGIYQHQQTNFLADHDVVLVGYGVSDGQTYWIAKNSWGANWGENGYFKIFARDSRIDDWLIYAVTDIAPSYQVQKKCEDVDKDGYCNWGLGSKPVSGCPVCNNTIEDCDDSNANVYKNCGASTETLGSLTINSTPAGAKVYVLNPDVNYYVYRGDTPLSINLKTGVRSIKVTKENYEDYITSVNILQNTQSAVTANFVTQPMPDTTSPALVSNLSSTNISQTSTTLTWTAPGDDANTGRATSYDIRYSTAAITEANWASATQLPGEPAPSIAGTQDSYIVIGLSPDTLYYFALKTTDEAGNTSLISNILSAKTQSSVLTLILSALPNSGVAPLNNVSLTARVSGTAAGNINYTFYCNRTDSGTNITNPYSHKLDNTSSTNYTASNICNYSAVGTYTAKVIAERGNLQTENRISIVVSSTAVNVAAGGGGGGGGDGGGLSDDAVPPNKPASFKAETFDKGALLTWQNPTDGDFVRVLVVRKNNAFPTSRTDGTAVYEGNLQEFRETNLENGKTYYYAIYSYDKKPNYSEAVLLQLSPRAGVVAPPFSPQAQQAQQQIQQTGQTSQTSFSALKGPFFIGKSSEETKLLQQMLAQDISVYPKQKITGYYGLLTIEAVQKFQLKYNISGPGYATYGKISPKTMAKLNELYASKPSGATPVLSADKQALIKLLQEQIAKLIAQLIQMLQEEIRKKGGQPVF